MNVYIIALAMMASMASATWPVVVVGSTSTVAVSGAAVLLGAKLLAAKGLLLGAALSRRGRRETISETFLEASKKDQYDCAKMLICELNAKPVHTLEVRKCLLFEAANLRNGNSLQKINIVQTWAA